MLRIIRFTTAAFGLWSQQVRELLERRASASNSAFISRFHSTSNDGSASPTSSNPNNNVSRQQGEIRLKEKLSLSFPSASRIEVEDISGGCGSMYQIHVESVDFSGLNTVKQHQLVTKALHDDIKGMHGVRISTKVPIKST